MKNVAGMCFVFLCAAATVKAAPIVLPANQPIYFQFNNLEQVNASNSLVVPGGYNGVNTQGNWGVFNLSSIQFGAVSVPRQNIAGGPVFFSDDGAGGTAGQVTGIFFGSQFTSATDSTGGIIDLYWHDAGADPITANCLADVGNICEPNAATVAAFTSGTFLGRLLNASGIISGNPVTTIRGSLDPTSLGGATGQADSFANVDLTRAGAWTDVLNGNWFDVDTNGNGTFGEAGEVRDVRFSNRYSALPAWNDPSNAATGTTVGLQSNDPGRVFTAAPTVTPVPEPATWTLLSLGLAGLVARARKNKKS